MEDRLIGGLDLAVGLRVSNSNKLRSAAQVVEMVHKLTGVKLPVVVKNDGARNAEASDNVSSNEPSYPNSGYRGYGLGLYPFCEVVNHYKKVLTLPHSLAKRAEEIHSPCGKRQGANDWRYGGGGDSLDGGEPLAFVTGSH